MLAALVSLLLVATVLVAVGLEKSTPEGTDSESAAPQAVAPSSGLKAAKMGVFRGGSPSEVTAFGEWAGRDVEYALDYSTRKSWEDIARPQYMLDTWKGRGYRMVYGTAMLPTEDGTATIAAGARGEYNHYFDQLARNLVAADQEDAILRLGWEFNLRDSRWHPQARAQDFISYWQNIVKTMRSVPGAEHLQFDWNVNPGGNAYDPRTFYPGNDYVDYIGVDVYDIAWVEGSYPYPRPCPPKCRRQRRETAWNETLNGDLGLRTWAKFAREQGRPMSLPEWGVWRRPDGHGGGDNPFFMEQMLNFIDDRSNNVAYQAYFEFNVGPGGTHELSELTRSGRKFRERLTRG